MRTSTLAHGGAILDEYAAGALERDELLSPVEPTKLEAQLVELYRRNHSTWQKAARTRSTSPWAS